MKNFKLFLLVLIALFSFQFARSQDLGMQGYALMGTSQKTIALKQTVIKTRELYRFDRAVSSIFGLGIKADIKFNGENSLVRIILVDQLNREYLVYETYPLLETKSSFSIDNLCEETAILNAVKPQSLRIEITDASISVKSVTYSTGMDKRIDFQKVRKDKKNLQNNRKILQINKSIESRRLAWVAGNTGVSEMSYAEKKKLYGQSSFPPGFEYYVGGVFQTGEGVSLKSANISSIVDNWDWRNRHGKNWMTSVKNQGSCGSCWSFAVTGATEAQVNLFYNQPLNMDLSEQNILSCSGAGSCSGGYPSIALDYIKNTGIVDEAAFPYTATNQVCTNKYFTLTDQIKIGGREDFGSASYPVSENNLKKMIIKYGPVSGGLLNMSHAMTLVGWKVVEEGDKFLYYDINKIYRWATIPAGSTLIGKTVWLFKNSWGDTWGDAGYFYVETDITNFAWTHALLTPVQSLKQNYTVQYVDNDHDGYYWWGLGPKPAICPGPNQPDGDDSNASLGPLDENGNCIVLNGSPVADFNADKTAVSVGGSVNFTDLSTNSPTSWVWTFDGGTPATSTETNPVVTYNSTGVYNVTLVAKNAAGSNTKIKSGYITVNIAQIAPLADFIANKFSLDENTSATFTDLSTNSPTSLVWTFDGGTPDTSTETTPVVSYNKAGIYNVTLVAKNAAGSNTKIKSGYITVNIAQTVPLADFTSDKVSLNENTTATFTDLSTNSPTSLVWTFDGGTPATSTETTPVVSYNKAGIYNVTLVAKNAAGSNTKIKSGYITVNSSVVVPNYCYSNGYALKEWITGILLNGSNFTSASSAKTGYEDFTSKVFNVDANKTYPITLTPKYSGKANPSYWSIWIDFNHDSDFNDPGELVLAANNMTTLFSKSISIPSSALTGPTRLRVSMKRSAIALPCESFSYGEVEDYTINISAPASEELSLKNATTGFTNNNKPIGFKLFPNPVGQTLNLMVEKVFEEDNYSIFNISGVIMAKKPLDSSYTQVDVSSLPAGIYLLKIRNGSQSFQDKFVVER